MQVKYSLVVPADCTSDPHPVRYDDADTKGKLFETVLGDIVRVCESDMVQHVRSVRAVIGETLYDSDHYGESPIGDKPKHTRKVVSDMAKKHKIHGLYFWSDAEEGAKHLPPGLTGVKEIAKILLENSDEFDSLVIGVTWRFVGDSSCSDYIEFGPGTEHGGVTTVNYGSQDWWIEHKDYVPWCDEMEKFLGREFPRDGGRR